MRQRLWCSPRDLPPGGTHRLYGKPEARATTTVSGCTGRLAPAFLVSSGLFWGAKGEAGLIAPASPVLNAARRNWLLTLDCVDDGLRLLDPLLGEGRVGLANLRPDLVLEGVQLIGGGGGVAPVE